MNENSRASRRVSVGVYCALFLGAATQTEITPLLPHIRTAFGVSEAAIGLLVAAPAIMVLALCVPIGLLTDRLGARRLTIAACLLLSLSAFGQAIPSYGAVVVARVAFGAAFGALLTAGVAWVSQAGERGGSSRLGATVTCTSVGMIAGPAIGGLLGPSAGLSAPFLLAGAASAIVTVGLVACPALAARTSRERPRASVRDAVAATRVPGVRAAAAGLAISGAVAGTTQLLVPLELHASRFSTGAIGLAFSVAAIAYIIVSALVVGAGQRAVSLRVNAVAAGAVSLALLPAALGVHVTAVLATLIAVALARAVVGTICYPLATSGGAGDARGGVALGVVNATWAAGLVAAPLVAGALSPALGVRGVWLALFAVTAAGALVLWRDGRAVSVASLAAATRTARRPRTAAAPTMRSVRLRRLPRSEQSRERSGR
jgi:MFS family permease